MAEARVVKFCTQVGCGEILAFAWQNTPFKFWVPQCNGRLIGNSMWPI